VFAKIQDYDRVDMQGAGEQKPVFIITPAAAEKIGDISGVKVSAQVDVSRSKKYVSHVIFSGGTLDINPGFIGFLDSLARKAPSQKAKVPVPPGLREESGSGTTAELL
jgi:hypothetical protein